MKKKFHAIAVVALFGCTPVLAQDKITFATNWLAQAEHGGHYQAVADGTYKFDSHAISISAGYNF